MPDFGNRIAFLSQPVNSQAKSWGQAREVHRAWNLRRQLTPCTCRILSEYVLQLCLSGIIQVLALWLEKG